MTSNAPFAFLSEWQHLYSVESRGFVKVGEVERLETELVSVCTKAIERDYTHCSRRFWRDAALSFTLPLAAMAAFFCAFARSVSRWFPPAYMAYTRAFALHSIQTAFPGHVQVTRTNET